MQMSGFFYWEYSKTADCLMLCSDSTHRKIRTALKSEMLNRSIINRCDCEMEDFQFYNQVMELIEDCDLIPEQQLEFIAHSAVAVKRFLLPSQPKSWFFDFADDYNPASFEQLPCLVQAQVKQNQQNISLLLLNSDGNTADCLLLEPEFNLPGLQLQFGQPLRIFKNRLQLSTLNVDQFDQSWQQKSA
jgi:hypothetical protein